LRRTEFKCGAGVLVRVAEAQPVQSSNPTLGGAPMNTRNLSIAVGVAVVVLIIVLVL
jgi:hypothetical protein